MFIILSDLILMISQELKKDHSLLPMLTTQEYRASPLVFLLLGGAMMGFGIYQIQLYLVLLSGRGLSGLSMMTAALCVNSVLNVLVIPLAGLSGAAGVACLSNLLLAVLTGRAAREGVSFAFPWRKTLGISARGMLAALCIMAAGYGVDLSSPPVMLAALLAGALLYILPDMFRPGSPPRLLLGMS